MNTHAFLSALCLGFSSAVIAVVILCIMDKEPILNWWFALGSRIGIRHPANGPEQERWFYKPIWGCEKCFAGQICLWVYVFNHIAAHKLQESIFGVWDVSLAATPDFSFFCLLFAVCTAIITAVFLSHHINQKIV